MRIAGGVNCGRKILVPSFLRPTLEKVREAVFSIIEVEGKSFLDIYAGSGAMGLEALSRGAKEAWFIERSPRVLAVLKKNIENLGETNAKVIKGNAVQIIKRLNRTFDIVFMDPPYDRGLIQKTVDVLNGITTTGTLVIIEHSRRETFSPNGFNVYKEKQYGDTCLTILVKEEY